MEGCPNCVFVVEWCLKGVRVHRLSIVRIMSFTNEGVRIESDPDWTWPSVPTVSVMTYCALSVRNWASAPDRTQSITLGRVNVAQTDGETQSPSQVYKSISTTGNIWMTSNDVNDQWTKYKYINQMNSCCVRIVYFKFYKIIAEWINVSIHRRVYDVSGRFWNPLAP